MNFEKLKAAEVVEGEKLGLWKQSWAQRKLLVFGMDCDTDTLGL